MMDDQPQRSAAEWAEYEAKLRDPSLAECEVCGDFHLVELSRRGCPVLIAHQEYIQRI